MKRFMVTFCHIEILTPLNQIMEMGVNTKTQTLIFGNIHRRLFICQQIVLSRQVMLYIVLLQNEKDTEQMEPWLRREMDSCISSIFLNEDQDSFIQLFNLILSESVNGMNLMGYLKCRC